MFGRPRCREWTPLATQQLRLRSLIQIVGYNIRPPEWCMYQCSFYLTLHHTTMSAPFYTSERICSPHPKWKEIDSEITQRMSSTNIVIRIWGHVINPNDDSVQDSILQTWGVYLSGLRYIGANLASNFNSDCFKSNTLVFQMHGGYFCSYKSLKLDIIPPENEHDHSSLSSDSSGRTSLSKHLDKLKESRSISPSKYTKKIDKEYSKSHSPVERGLQHNFPTIRTSASLNISRNDAKTDPNNIYEYSPENLNVKEFTTSDINCDNLSKNTQEEILNKIDLSETAESYDLRNEADGVPKYRYLALSFLKSEIRPSYTASKLQKLHLLQYSIKKKQEAVQEIKERIYKNSALNDSINLEENIDEKLRLKSRSQRNLFSMDSSESLDKEKSGSQSDLNGRIKEAKPTSNGPRLGLKLNDLLSFKSKPSPFQRAEHIRLTKQLEILRFKRIILSDERDSKLANIRRLKEMHAKLAEENQDVGTELMQQYHSLSRRVEATRDARVSCAALRDLAAATHAQLAGLRAQLLTELHDDIFYIKQEDPVTWSIAGAPLCVCGEATARPARDAARDAAGAVFAARALRAAAALSDRPLRYPQEDAAGRLLLVDGDGTQVPVCGESASLWYALFLLNKSVAQLCVARGLPVADIRPTLLNLQRAMTEHQRLADTSKLYGIYRWTSDTQCPRTQSLRSLIASERGKYRQFNRFKDAVDGQSPQSAMDVRRHRHSRSVGSYHDDKELAALNTSTTSIMGSESNIYNMKLPQIDSTDLTKKHNSDTEIENLTETDDKVLFTLGDDTNLIDLESKLVRLSTNNGDEVTCQRDDVTCQGDDICQCLGDNVKKICSEITDFCTKDVQEGFDVAKYMETRENMCASEMEEADQCLSYEGKGEGECHMKCAKLMSDNVLPSAEDVLDTGQNNNGETVEL